MEFFKNYIQSNKPISTIPKILKFQTKDENSKKKIVVNIKSLSSV